MPHRISYSEICENVLFETAPSEHQFREVFFKNSSVGKIRNSALHIEDHSRGFGTWKDKKKGKKMETSDFLGLINLEGSFLCSTIDDGIYKKVEISVGVFNILGQIMNHLLASFQWEGSPRIKPHY
ncbi:hypothetical protein [Pseudoalteromonas rubra]|uniref:Uncharacterized protein n=1 Tax=Pseudoalteromonas rubra TaxID=43658 RepID=A0A0F4QC55_9GAMM|nr:hypothetical protein [Pseudoalteromonas rubra]KJZ05253.1 hypothetical protein TW77_23035 [Pseudoalteromonas rubra]